MSRLLPAVSSEPDVAATRWALERKLLPSDPANEGRDSADMLRAAHARVAAAGWRLVNLDCVIFAQRPKILPHRQRIRERIAEILGVDMAAVWLKAKTGEHVGPIGEELAIGAECVVLVERARPE